MSKFTPSMPPPDDDYDPDNLEPDRAPVSPSPQVGKRAGKPAYPKAVPPAPRTIPELTDQFNAACKSFNEHKAAYAVLLQTIEIASTDCNWEEADIYPPKFEWANRADSPSPVEIVSDISQLAPTDIVAVLTPLANLHAGSMLRALRTAKANVDELLRQFTTAQQEKEGTST